MSKCHQQLELTQKISPAVNANDKVIDNNNQNNIAIYAMKTTTTNTSYLKQTKYELFYIFIYIQEKEIYVNDNNNGIV